MDIIYIGSGKSASLIHSINKEGKIIVCANNAWRLFSENQSFDYWFHSGDFPYENYPTKRNFTHEISHKEYLATARSFVDRHFAEQKHHKEHYIGYTIFFQGLYWIMEELKPSNIYLLGFDHDYNKEKTQKWKEIGQPTPTTFLQENRSGINDWAKEFFKEYQEDFFYGHGTPDPLRLGEDYLIEKFKIALDISQKLGINIYNASSVENEINCFPKKELTQNP
jgi:hypothetical protein